MSVSAFIAYLLFVLADSVIYISISWWLAKSFKFHRFGVVAFLILIVPIFYPLVYAGSLLNVLWMLLLIPFYGLFVMIILYPILMLLYYAISFGSLLTLFFLRKSYGDFKGVSKDLVLLGDLRVNSSIMDYAKGEIDER